MLDYELENIAQLLLSADTRNSNIALAYLEAHPRCIHLIKEALEVYLLEQPKDTKTKQLFDNTLKDYQLTVAPIYALHLPQKTLSENIDILYQFTNHMHRYDKWLLSTTKRAKHYSYLAQVLAEKHQNIALCRTLHEKLIQHKPLNAEFHYDLAHSLHLNCSRLNTKETARLIDAYKTSYGLLAQAKTALGLARFYDKHLKSVTKAINILETARTDFGDNLAILIYLSQLYIKQKKWRKALHVLQHSISISSSDDHCVEKELAWSSMGILYEKGLKVASKAQEYYEKTLLCNPFNPQANDYLIQAYSTQKKYPKAIHQLQLLLSEQPFNILYKMRLAKLYDENKQPKAAKATYLEILNLAPNYTPAIEAIKKIDH